MDLMDEKSEQQARLAELKDQHRSLDGDSLLEIQRLKKEKLSLRDGITRLEAILFPDIIA